jgi:hypothetical protein
MKWQPIATAPKDGTLVRVRFYRPNVFESADGNHQDWECNAIYDASDQPPLTASPWQNENGQGFFWTPTHWMPLPAPPSNK